MASPKVFVGLSGIRSLCNELKRPGNRFQGSSKTYSLESKIRVYLVDRNYQFFDPSQEDEAISSVLKTLNDCEHIQQSLSIKTLEIPHEIYERLNHRFPPDEVESLPRSSTLISQWMHSGVETGSKPGSGNCDSLRIQFVGLHGLRHRDPFSSLKILGILRSFDFVWFRGDLSLSEDVDPHQLQAEGAFKNLDISISRDISWTFPRPLFCRLKSLSIEWNGESSAEMGSSSCFFDTLLELPSLNSLSMIGADESIIFAFLASFNRTPASQLDTLSMGLVRNVSSSLEGLAKTPTVCKILSFLSIDLGSSHGYIASIPPMIDSLKSLRLRCRAFDSPDGEYRTIPECILRYLRSKSAASIRTISLVGISVGTNEVNVVSHLPLQDLFLTSCSFEAGALRAFGESDSLQRGLRSLTLRHVGDDATLMELVQHTSRFLSLKEISMKIKELSKNVLDVICRVIQESRSIVELTLTHEEFDFLLFDFSNNGEEVRRVFYKYLLMEATIEDEECRRLANHFATLIPYSL